MITDKDYTRAFKYLVRTVPAIGAWYGEYTSTGSFYKVSGQIVRSFELYRYFFIGDLSKLEVPCYLPQEIHDKAMEVLKDIDVKAVLLKIKLGV